MERKACWEEWEAAGHMASAVRKQRETKTRIPVHGMALPVSKWSSS